MAGVLHLRRFLVLHASAVDIGGEAVAFLGASRSGKSTIAAALCRKGYDLVTDDVLALDLDANSKPGAVVAYPQLRVWPDTASALGQADLPTLTPHFEKRAHRVRSATRETLPLSHIYVLRTGTASGVHELPAAEAQLALVQHGYMAEVFRFGGERAHFIRCADLLKQVSVQGLERGSSLCQLDELVETVVQDVSDSRSCSGE